MMEVDYTKNNYLNRWHVYYRLKYRKGDITLEELTKSFKGLIDEDYEEFNEGIIEYNLMAKRNKKHYNEFKTKGDK